MTEAIVTAPPAKQTLPFVAIVAQSVGNMGVSAVVALLVPLVAVTAGSGGWLTWILCSLAILLVALCISQLARRFATTGGLYGLAGKALGPLGAIITGWSVVILVGVLNGGVVIGFGAYASQFLDKLGLPNGPVTLAIAYLVGLAAAVWFARAGIERSATVMLVLEVITVLIITALLVAVLIGHHGGIVDHSQLTLQGSDLHLVLLGIVLAVLSFGGFESATVLGREARNPLQAIPRAMIATVVFAGIFWTFAGYTLYLGFEGTGVNLATSSEPLLDLANVAGVPWFRYLLDVSVSLTLFASLIASFNGVARMLATIAREGLAPRFLARHHPTRGTPTAAIYTIGAAWLVTVIIVVAINAAPLDVVDLLGDFAGYAYSVVYALICIAALVYLRRKRELTVGSALAAVVPVITLAYVLYNSVVPFPAWPDNVPLIGSIIGFAGMLVGYVVLRVRSPEVLARVGSSVDADTAAAEAS
jgi:amino acid transporter